MDINDIIEAEKNIKDVIIKDNIEKNQRLSKKYNANVYFKREDLQIVRSFKIRGAYNLISKLSDKEKKRGIVCASAGNHAQGTAFACKKFKIKGSIFMPIATPNQKVEKVKSFGEKYVDIQLHGTSFEKAIEKSKKFCKLNNMVFVHPFEDERVIAGQGTIGKELYDYFGDELDFVFVPIGGGGLISGISMYIKEKNPKIKIIGVEPKGIPSMYESIKNKKIKKIKKIDKFVDGLAVSKISKKTFEIVKKTVDDFILSEEGEIAKNMIDLYQNEGIIVEPAGAVSLSALENQKDKIKGKNIVCIISGGNNDILRYPEIQEKSLIWQGKKHYFIINFTQKSGQLKKLVNNILGKNDDISRFEYIKKTNKGKGPALVGLQFKNKNDVNKFIDRLKKNNFDFIKLDSDNILYDYLI